MKKFTSLLIGCSLALAGAALAQPPTDQQSPTQQQGQATEKGHKGKANKAEKNANRAENPANSEATTATTQGGAKAERRAAKGQTNDAMPKTDASTAAATDTNVSGQAGAGATVEGKQGKKGKHGRRANAQTLTGATGATGATPTAATTDTNVSGQAGAGTTIEGKQGKKGKHGRGANAQTMTGATGATGAAATASVAPSVVGATGQENARVKGAGKAKKLETQKVEQIKTQHANFKAQPRPDKVPAVTFNQSYRIEGSDHWQGRQYEVFRSYHPERHDQGWYHQRYQRVELIGGGYYYMNNGYWYPAWGYNPSNEYYAYDGPIYVGRRAEPPDKVIADVQAELQDMGYYTGEVDGLLGPLTRQALTGYQADEGLTTTAAIDEPTLDALGLG